MKTVCFVCTGNTCRSIMAEHIFKKLLKQNTSLDFKVVSYGLNVHPEDKTNDKTIAALKYLGINARKKSAKQIDEKILKKCSLILTMNINQKNSLNSNNVFTLAELIGGEDIPDPYGHTQDVYNKIAEKIQDYIKILINKLLTLKENI